MTTPAQHFESNAQRAQAARLGMWVFLGSELLLFAGLFALYGASRAAAPAAFRTAIEHSEKVLGSINTLVLLVSSTSAALAVRAIEHDRRRACLLALGGTLLLAGAFLAIKLTEYRLHFREGIFPGGSAHVGHGATLFWTLYFVSTGLHAIHVVVGMGVLALAARGVALGQITSERAYVLENATLYWHLVDLIWIFLWPLYYLA